MHPPHVPARSADGTDHVLLTRFNLPTPGVESIARARDGWLRERVELFERFTVPSVEHQSRRPHWLVYLDPESPDWLVQRMTALAASGLLLPVYRATTDRDELLADLAGAVPQRGSFLITTNLDNDDALALDFCARVAAMPIAEPRAAIYLVNGLVRSNKGVYWLRDRRNAFCTVRETWDSPVTCYAEYHNELARIMPAVEVRGGPGWLQVIHGANVSNRIRGRRVAAARYADVLPGASGVPEPTQWELAADALWARPRRASRDAVRSTLRRTGLRVLGKDRYTRAKLELATLSRHLRAAPPSSVSGEERSWT